MDSKNVEQQKVEKANSNSTENSVLTNYKPLTSSLIIPNFIEDKENKKLKNTDSNNLNFQLPGFNHSNNLYSNSLIKNNLQFLNKILDMQMLSSLAKFPVFDTKSPLPTGLNLKEQNPGVSLKMNNSLSSSTTKNQLNPQNVDEKLKTFFTNIFNVNPSNNFQKVVSSNHAESQTNPISSAHQSTQDKTLLSKKRYLSQKKNLLMNPENQKKDFECQKTTMITTNCKVGDPIGKNEDTNYIKNEAFNDFLNDDIKKIKSNIKVKTIYDSKKKKEAKKTKEEEKSENNNNNGLGFDSGLGLIEMEEKKTANSSQDSSDNHHLLKEKKAFKSSKPKIRLETEGKDSKDSTDSTHLSKSTNDEIINESKESRKPMFKPFVVKKEITKSKLMETPSSSNTNNIKDTVCNEQVRKEYRKFLNRKAAKKCRQKKKVYMGKMLDENKILKERIKVLEAKTAVYEKHMKECQQHILTI